MFPDELMPVTEGVENPSAADIAALVPGDWFGFSAPYRDGVTFGYVLAPVNAQGFILCLPGPGLSGVWAVPAAAVLRTGY